MVQISLVVSVEVAGFGSEEQRRWRQVAVKRRRETVFGSWVERFVESGKFGVVFDSSGAKEEWVSAVAAV